MFNIKRVRILEMENRLLKSKVKGYELSNKQLKKDYKALELEQIAQGKRTCTGYCKVCKYGISMQNAVNIECYSSNSEIKYLCALNCKCADFKNKYD